MVFIIYDNARGERSLNFTLVNKAISKRAKEVCGTFVRALFDGFRVRSWMRGSGRSVGRHVCKRAL